MHFSVHTDGNNQLTGTADATYTEHYEFGSEGCKRAWTAGPLEWTSVLSGEYQQPAPGTVTLDLRADPSEGPSFSEDDLCTGSTPLTPSWPAVYGEVKNGIYDYRVEYPMTGGLTGHDILTVHINSVGG